MGGQVDALFFFMIALTGSVTLLVTLLIVYFAFRYRRRGDDRRIPVQIAGSRLLEIGWTVVPLLLFVVPFAWGAHVYIQLYRPEEDALEIHVLGKQWMWKFEHPGGQREIDTLHVPVGRPVTLIMTSQDVIHSLFVPVFRGKHDVLPGRYTTISFTATKPGRYHLFCAEYCGTDHSMMRGTVTVLDPPDYERWLARESTQSAASEGAKLFQQLGCFTCHRGDSLRRAPVLEGLYGQPVQLVNGQIVIADENYLRDSILEPAKDVVLGWQPIMPSFRGRVDDEQMLQLIAYIKSLGDAPRAAGGTLPPLGQPIFPER
jgi:cytochrome c oxidase subunit 2